MAEYTPPRRVLSTPTAITVQPAVPATLPWVPAPGYYNTVTRADNGLPDYASRVNPSFWMEDLVTPQVYGQFAFSGFTGYEAFFQMWEGQCGAAYNPLLGTHGMLMLRGGGHYGWQGGNVLAFDVGQGKWLNYDYPKYCNIEKTVTGGTVANLTGTLINGGFDSDSVNNRVAVTGNFIKTMDGVPIPGAGDATGAGASVFYPVPVHSNAGIVYLPPDAGGGTLGSILFIGHDNTGINVPTSQWRVWKFDCATKVYSGTLIGPYINSQGPHPALEYDSDRKLVWYLTVSGTQPFTLNYKNVGPTDPAQVHQLVGNTINFSGTFCGDLTYMPGRDIIVFLNSLQSPYNERLPTLNAFSIAGYSPNPAGTTYGCLQYPLVVQPSLTYYRAQIDAGLDTGWPGYRSLANGLAQPEEYLWNGATDNGNLMNSGWKKLDSGGNPESRGTGDRLEYCEADDCLIYLERRPGPGNNVPRGYYNKINLWKLIPPAKGNEKLGTWTWVKEELSETPGAGGNCFYKSTQLPSWGGRSRYIPALKCMIYTDRDNIPVGAVRSSTWT